MLNSLYLIHIRGVQNYSPLSFISYCLLKNGQITLCLTNLHFLWDSLYAKKLWRNLAVSQHFKACHQNESETGKNFAYSKATVLVLISHFRGMFIVILGGYLATRNNKSQIFGFSVLKLKFSTEIDIFIKFPQNGNFSHFSVDYPVQCCPENANVMQNFWSWYSIERFSEWCTTLWTSGYFKKGILTLVLVGLITK